MISILTGVLQRASIWEGRRGDVGTIRVEGEDFLQKGDQLDLRGQNERPEQLMVEAGFGGLELKMQQLKMRLRLIINAMIDQKIHTEGMTEEEAMDLMMNEGFQEEGEAAGKWRRACLSSAQLSTYYVGNMEFNDLRKSYEAKMEGEFDFKTMHDLMLSFGSPAPKYVKELMGL